MAICAPTIFLHEILQEHKCLGHVFAKVPREKPKYISNSYGLIDVYYLEKERSY